MSIYGERAVACHREGFNCSQAVVSSLCEEFGIDRVTALRFAGAFGSGIGHLTETCGAVTGAVMLIGMKYGKILPDDAQATPKSYEMAQRFFEEFRAQNDGKLTCKELLGADTNTPEGLAYVLDNELFSKLCPQYIRCGAEIAARMLRENPPEDAK
ncbi:MAG: C-GCAxxG-C-C family protein [Gemmiger sp.]|nr:C-GCAxxG-C-C family protein [Gemmiger sp.]